VLPRAIVRVEGGGATAYAGGYAAARAAWEAEATAREGAWRSADDERRKLERRLADARRAEAGATRNVRTSARMKGPRDSDARTITAGNLAMWAADGAGRRAAVLRGAVDD